MKTAGRFLGRAALCGLFACSIHAATLGFSPSGGTLSQGATFTEQVLIAGVSDLSAFPFDIGFDPTILSANSVVEGSFLGSGGATFFLAGTIDNRAGQITFTADSLQGSGPDGSGAMALITFTAAGPGISALNFFSVTLLGRRFNYDPRSSDWDWDARADFADFVLSGLECNRSVG